MTPKYTQQELDRRAKVEAQKVAKENKKLIDLNSIKDFFLTRTAAELVELFKEAKGSEADLLQWAKKETIIN